jgi:hypothetical protein
MSRKAISWYLSSIDSFCFSKYFTTVSFLDNFIPFNKYSKKNNEAKIRIVKKIKIVKFHNFEIRLKPDQ